MKCEKFMVEMLKDCEGQDVNSQGCSMEPRKYLSGQRYNIGERLYKCFIDLGVAKDVEQKKTVPAEENKMMDVPAENKAKKRRASKKKKA